MPTFSIVAGSAWHHVSPFNNSATGRTTAGGFSLDARVRTPSHEGVDNPSVAAKWAFYYSLEHEFLTSIALVADLPVGNKDIRNQSHTSLGPEFLWEKALGDLPNLPVLKYLRPLGFQGTVGYLPALGGQTSHDLSANAVIEYSLPYLSNNVQDIGLKWPLRNLFLFTEINYDQLIKGPSGQTFPSILATPGIAYVSYHYELVHRYSVRAQQCGQARHSCRCNWIARHLLRFVFPEMGQLDYQSRTRPMKTLKVCVAGALLVATLTAYPIVASAHSFPESETPSAGQTIAAAPSEVVINFDAPIEKLFAKVEVIGTDGKNDDAGAPQVSDDGRRLSVKLGALKPGDYTVKWAVVCIDTHHTEGSYTFSIASGGS